MARGTALSDIRAMVLAEIGDYGTPNQTRTQQINILTDNKQKWLASEYDFPFLQHFFDVNVNPGQQYVPIPAGYADDVPQAAILNFERPVIASVFWNQIYDDMDYGIGLQEYNWMNPALGQFIDPIQKWRLASDVAEPLGSNMFEVWPVPVTVQTVRFTGQRLVQELEADTDKADLDDMLLVYFVAGDILQSDNQASAKLKLELAQQRLDKLKAVYPSPKRTLILGGGIRQSDRELRRTVPMIAIAHG